jgi:hypothetical protein
MSGPVQGVTVVQALLLRTSLPDLPLHDGASFLARVASRGEHGKASLVIAGELIAAQVPDEVQQGQTLRLTVAAVTPERITLRMDPLTPPAVAAPPPPPPPHITVDQRPAGGQGGRGRGEAAVTLTYRSAALGTLRLRVATAPGAVAATVQVPQALLEAAQAGAERLRAGLAAQTGRTAAVHVVPGSVDVRA